MTIFISPSIFEGVITTSVSQKPLKLVYRRFSSMRYNRKSCMKEKSVSYVDLQTSTWTRRGPKGYAHGQAYWKSGRRSNDFGIGVGFRPTPS